MRPGRRAAQPLAPLVLLTMLAVTPAAAQVPDSMQGKLLLTLGGQDAGWETYRLEPAPGGYRLSGENELRVGSMTIAQRVTVLTDDHLAFRTAEFHGTLNGATTDAALTREDDKGRQTIIQGGDTTVQVQASPESSALLTNNVVHHIIQFAWLHSGDVETSVNLTAFPKVPVTVTLEESGEASRDGATLEWRRYYLNLANQFGAYVWLDRGGAPLKVTVPLQSFAAVSEAYREWADLLPTAGGERDASSPPGYEGEDVRFESADIVLAGTLTVPRGAGPFPAAVLISGSGPQDRDENTPGPGGLKLGIFRSLADTVTGRGIAVLRYDDRGVGGSGGKGGTFGLSDLVGDVEAALSYLRSRPEINGGRLALVGHSEGGIIAPIVAAEDDGVAAIVLMAGTATPLDSVLIEQAVRATRDAGGDSDAIGETRHRMEVAIDAIRQGREPEDGQMVASLRAAAGQRKWLLEHFRHDPLATIRRVRAPVLIVNGGQDVQVPPWHAERLGAALADAGHPDYEVHVFPRLNHLFAVSRGEGTAEYADSGARVDPAFLSYLADWLCQRLVHD